MLTTLEPGQKKNSNMQEMGETREPMAKDCWEEAQNLALQVDAKVAQDFWLLYVAKGDKFKKHVIRAAWHVTLKRPETAIVGSLAFKWSHKDKRLSVDAGLSLPYDIPLSEAELSKNEKDVFPTLGEAAAKSKAILLA